MTPTELEQYGWDSLDIILVTGDAYLDSPHVGVAVIGKYLVSKGYRVGIIAQPNIQTGEDITRFGEPRIFWGVTAGCVDSMVANYTPLLKKRREDDFTPGGKNTKRPNRASIVYANLIRQYFKNTCPIVLGGVEASMRRISHYDYWQDRIRKPLLFDAKADYLVYGMGEQATLELTQALEKNRPIHAIRGICYLASEPPTDALILPDFDSIVSDNTVFETLFQQFYKQSDPYTAQRIAHRVNNRYLVQNPPSFPLYTTELDAIYELPYERAPHPSYHNLGSIRAMDTIRFSITTHRGCYGECNFCSIAIHQGRIVISRSDASILAEVDGFAFHPQFRGVISNVGGPTANMYGIECQKKQKSGSCTDKRCLFPSPCAQLPIEHKKQYSLLNAIRKRPHIRHAFIGSGVRFDMVLADKQSGMAYLDQLIGHHISGQLKIAPEHTHPDILQTMGKPTSPHVSEFVTVFYQRTKALHSKRFLTYYFIAAHPGCNHQHMVDLKRTLKSQLRINPEQIQIFTPLPSTYSALMYYTCRNPFNGKSLFVEKEPGKKQLQKHIILHDRLKKGGT